ncbi:MULTISPECIES: hypothetical protein [unclassified Bradyrhizobium]|uniref:hypothetical protein n=1 Tax=unclassified Bradyrhizobium TaxID=2631580 RepID=UPI0033988F4E
MQVDGELGGQPNSIVNQADRDAQLSPNEGARTKKVTVQLSESMYQRLEVASERPGLGKSMVVETALERFLNPAPPEGRVHEALDGISGQMARLEHEIAIIAEIVALHARYHLTVTPPILPSGQREACLLGQQRFKVLAEQVERRVRLGQPLIRETIDRLGKGSRPGGEALGGASQRAAEQQSSQEGLSAVAADGNSEPSAAAVEGGSAPNFRNLPNSFC